MSKFKIGDKVLYSLSGNALMAGTIKEINPTENDILYKISYSDNVDAMWVSEENIQGLSKAPHVAKFGVGDRVKIVAPRSCYHDKTGTIVRVDRDDNGLEYYIHLDYISIEYTYAYEEDLELIKPKEIKYAEKQFMDIKKSYDDFVDTLHLDETQKKAFDQFMNCLLKYIAVGIEPGLDYINHNKLAYDRVVDYLKNFDKEK